MRCSCFVITSVIVLLLYGFSPVGQAQDAGVPNVSTITEQDLEGLKAEHKKRRQAFSKAITAAPSQKERERISEDFRAYWFGVIDEMIAIAKRQPSSNVGRQAALWVVKNCDPDFEPHVRAAEILLEHHSGWEELGTAYSNLDGFHAVYEKLLRVGATSNPSQTSRGHATFQLAELLGSRSDFRGVMDVTPELRSERTENMGEHVVEHLMSTDRERDRAEAKRLYKLVRRKFSGVVYRDRALGDVAAERLLPLEQTYPEIGKAAPRITGRDLRGNPLALEDHRGKVVVISFWASWCGPCLARIPGENQLIEHFKDEPFVLFGVNGDASVENAIQAVEDHDIRFTSWWDDPATDTRTIDRYGVSSWPTTFVLDQEGIIRNKNLFGSDLHEAVDRLLNAGEMATGNGEQTHATEPAAGLVRDGELSAPAR